MPEAAGAGAGAAEAEEEEVEINDILMAVKWVGKLQSPRVGKFQNPWLRPRLLEAGRRGGRGREAAPAPCRPAPSYRH